MKLSEKIKKMFSEEDNKKKTENLIFLLIILIITVIAINYIWKDEQKTKKEDNNKTYEKQLASSNTTEITTLEEKLEKILSQIEGTGSVSVLITYNESTEVIPMYNESNKKSVTNETDSNGGTRTIEETDVQTEVIYNQNDNNSIITKKTVNPKIEGAVITATGADNATVKSNIIQAVQAATGLASHKIQVFKKKI